MRRGITNPQFIPTCRGGCTFTNPGPVGPAAAEPHVSPCGSRRPGEGPPLLRPPEMFIVLEPSPSSALPDWEGKEIKNKCHVASGTSRALLAAGDVSENGFDLFSSSCEKPRKPKHRRLGARQMVAVLSVHSRRWCGVPARPEAGIHLEAMTILPSRGLAKRGHPQNFKVTSRTPAGGGACVVGTDISGE